MDIITRSYMLITSERLTCSTMLKLEAKIQKAPSQPCRDNSNFGQKASKDLPPFSFCFPFFSLVATFVHHILDTLKTRQTGLPSLALTENALKILNVRFTEITLFLRINSLS